MSQSSVTRQDLPAAKRAPYRRINLTRERVTRLLTTCGGDTRLLSRAADLVYRLAERHADGRLYRLSVALTEQRAAVNCRRYSYSESAAAHELARDEHLSAMGVP